MSDVLLHFSNDYLAEYIAGVYDSDGSIYSRAKGSNCIDLTTCSEVFARQIQLVLLRFGLRANLRERKVKSGKIIKSKLNKWVLEIRSFDQIKRFASNIPLRHSKKILVLNNILSKKITSNTNTDIIPVFRNL